MGQKRGQSRNGIFGEVQAWSNACEEQSRFTLHGHMCVWIKNFNKRCELLFHEKEDIREKASRELTDYFKLVAQATFGELQFSQRSLVANETFVSTPNEVLKPVSKQKIRDMRHHIHSQKLGGVIATPKQEVVDAFTGQSTYKSSDLIKNNTCTLIPPTMGLDITKNISLI